MAANKNSIIRGLVPLLLTWFATNARDLPWRRTRDAYAIWISEIMLQQTQVKTVVPYWERWMGALPTVKSVSEASPAKLHKLWEGLGYYTRVRNLQKAARQIIAQHDGRFPDNFDEILALPGIGRYTAGAIASIAFNQPRPILDGNVIRVLTRIFGIKGDPREKLNNRRLWQLAEELVLHASRMTFTGNPQPPTCSRLRIRTKHKDDARDARPSCSHLNQSLMELGALVCTPRSPHCECCPVKRPCIARQQNMQESIPNPDRRARSINRHIFALVVERSGKFLVRQRPNGVINAHLWEFPNVDVGARHSGPQRLLNPDSPMNSLGPQPTKVRRLRPPSPKTICRLGFKLTAAKPLCVIKHSITRYRITLEAYHAESPGRRRAPHGRWLTLPQLHQLAFSSAHKKILSRLESLRTASAASHPGVRTSARPTHAKV